MGLLSRISTLIKSNLNDLISRAEDPEKILEQSILDMQTNLREAKKEVVESLANQKVLEKKLEAVKEEQDTWEGKAMSAVQAGDDDLAREALKRKQAAAARAVALEEQLSVQKDYVETLRASLAALESKIEEAKSKKTQLISRLRAAKVKEDMIAAREVALGTHKALEDDTAFAAFARMEEKILQIEGRVEAMEELSNIELGGSGDLRKDLLVEKKLKELKAHGQVEDELLRLKAKMEERVDPLEDELEALKRRMAESEES